MAPKLDMIGLIVADIERSLAFYRALGLDVPSPAEGSPYTEFTFPNGMRMSWNHVDMMKEILGHWEEPRGIRMGIALLCDSPAQVDEVYNGAVSQGFKGTKEPWDAFWGQRYAVLEDPDGNAVDLFAPLS
jgi:catechol 2,3-dioxygenase-like lactoylglutathione lyase family enzyme